MAPRAAREQGGTLVFGLQMHALITVPNDPHGQALFVWQLERFRRS